MGARPICQCGGEFEVCCVFLSVFRRAASGDTNKEYYRVKHIPVEGNAGETRWDLRCFLHNFFLEIDLTGKEDGQRMGFRTERTK